MGPTLSSPTAPSWRSFYFRYTDSAGRKRAIAIGGFDPEGAKGLTLGQARDKAGALSKLYRDGIKDLHEHLERVRDAADRARRAEEEATRAAAADAQRGTLRQLLETYVGHLERAGKQSARDVRNIFRANVLEMAPDLADRKAFGVSSDVRAQLQSHGLGGIQQRHYDRHDYALEKRQALQKWVRHLAALEAGEVVPTRKRHS